MSKRILSLGICSMMALNGVIIAQTQATSGVETSCPKQCSGTKKPKCHGDTTKCKKGGHKKRHAGDSIHGSKGKKGKTPCAGGSGSCAPASPSVGTTN